MKRLQELAFLNRGVKIIFKDDRNGSGDEFHYERGIIEFVEHLNRASDALHNDVIYLDGELTPKATNASASKSPCNTRANTPRTFTRIVNNIHTTEGGTHVSGFRTALTRTLNNYGKKEDLLQRHRADRRRLSAKG